MAEQLTELEMQQMELHTLREELGLNRKDFALEYGIPLRTIEEYLFCKDACQTCGGWKEIFV